MVTALYRATRGESYVSPPVTNREDEIGKLALVLQAFQENVRKIRQTSIELEERRNYLNAVLSTMIDGIVAIDEAGTIQLVNRAIEGMFGYGEGELLGKNATTLMPAATDAPPRLYLEPFMVVRKEKYADRNREAMARRKDGHLFPVEMMVTEMSSGGVIYFVGTLRDITERKIAEEEHDRYLQDLENSNRELDDFAYIASHDLKEPLRGLHNFSKFLLEDYSERLDDEGRNMLNTLASLTQQMEGLLNALLHYSRLGRTEMSIRETDLNQIVQNVLQMFSIKIKETRATIEIPRKLPKVTCDHVRIAEVFQNLIGNALKYNDGGDIRIEIGCTRAHPQHPGENVFYVKDNGIGIAEKNLDSIFKIFHRLHPRNAYGGGTGSGLTITKKIINRHGGEIWAESPGRGLGTTFYFTIPQHAHDGRAASPGEAARPGGMA
jgi:PAS domain S-box-containing protein